MKEAMSIQERKQGQRMGGAKQHRDREGLDRLGPHRAHRPPKAGDKIPALAMMPNSTEGRGVAYLPPTGTPRASSTADISKSP